MYRSTAILYPTYYDSWSNEKLTTKLVYSSLFPNYDRKNPILYVYYNVIDKKYLFMGTKYSFIFPFTFLNEQEQFISTPILLTEPLYFQCLNQSNGKNKFIMALLLGILISFVLTILIIIFIYFNTIKNEKRTNELNLNTINKSNFKKEATDLKRKTSSHDHKKKGKMGKRKFAKNETKTSDYSYFIKK